MTRLLSNLNPESNLVMRALVYAVGIGGLLHFASLLVVAIRRHDSVWFNPLFAVDLDRVFPGLKNNFLTFFGGWAMLAAATWLTYTIIKKK